MTTPLIPELVYYESFRMYDYDDDGEEVREHVHWACGICDREIMGPEAGAPRSCPVHAPKEIPGLELAECTATPRHPHTWFFRDDAGYGPPCMYCAYDGVYQAHRDCAHARHGDWRGWKVTRRAVRWLSLAEIITGYSTGNTCGGPGVCITNVRWRWTR